MTQLFRQSVIDKRKHRLSGGISLVQPPVFKSIALLLSSTVVVSILFLSLQTYTRKETVNGVLQPDKGLLRLRAPQKGIVTQLLVQEGQKVSRGQPLLRIRSEQHGAQGFELNQSLITQYDLHISSLALGLAQQKVKHRLEIQALNNDLKNANKRLAQLDQQSDIFRQRITINQQMSSQIHTLANTGYISELELSKQKDNLLSLNQQANAINAERLTINNQVAQLDNQLLQQPINQAKENSLVETQLVQLHAKVASIKQKRLSELRAPADGTVTGLLAKLGKGVDNNQNLLSVLPKNSELQAVIYVPTSAFGFIEKQQKVRMRYFAFPYQKFGVYNGIIAQISSNVILPGETDIPGQIKEPAYRVVVKLQEQNIPAYGQQIGLRSGMKLEADIVIERRSLIRWLFDPLYSSKG